jgi:hypothetical protein
MDYYDIVIVGAGPCGLSLAHCCSNIKNIKILIIDKEKTIGGCHRVKRVTVGKYSDIFTEHGPRIYLSIYYNLFYLMSEMGLSINDVFTNYKYNFLLLSITKILPNFSLYEIVILTYVYLLYLLNEDYGNDINLRYFLESYGFQSSSKDIFDKLCRFSDGSGYDKYSLNKIIKIFDIISLTNIYQPKYPLDISLFSVWYKYLEQNNVDFLLGTNITYINKNDGKIDYIVLDDNIKIACGKLILAVPPIGIKNIIKKNKEIKDAFGDFETFDKWAEKTEYIEYISITYHFKDNIKINELNGLALDTDWALRVINLSDYMSEIEIGYKKVLSVAICKTDVISKYTHKTANECSKEELYKEVYRQMKMSIYPDLPDNYLAVLNPNNYYNININKWGTEDEAFFNTFGTKYIPFQSKNIDNLYNAGTHNGASYFSYTTMESAVSNGISLACILFPSLRNKYYIHTFVKGKDIILFLITFILILVIILHNL